MTTILILTHLPAQNDVRAGAWCGVPLDPNAPNWTWQRDRVRCQACKHVCIASERREPHYPTDKA